MLETQDHNRTMHQLDRLLTLVRQPGLTPGSLIDEVIGTVSASIVGCAAFVGYLDYPQERFWVLDADGDASFGLSPGLNVPIGESFCFHMATGRGPQLCNDSARDPVYGSLAVQAELGIGSYIGVPLERRDGRRFGSLCAVAHSAFAFTMADRDLLLTAARVLSHGLDSPLAPGDDGGLRTALIGALEAQIADAAGSLP